MFKYIQHLKKGLDQYWFYQGDRWLPFFALVNFEFKPHVFYFVPWVLYRNFIFPNQPWTDAGCFFINLKSWILTADNHSTFEPKVRHGIRNQSDWNNHQSIPTKNVNATGGLTKDLLWNGKSMQIPKNRLLIVWGAQPYPVLVGQKELWTTELYSV